MRCGSTAHAIGRAHRSPELGQRIATRERADEEGVVGHGVPEQSQRQRKIVHGVERADGQNKIVGCLLRHPKIFGDCLSADRRGEQGPGVSPFDPICEGQHSLRPSRVGASNQQGVREPPLLDLDPFQTIVERPFEEKQLRPDARRAVTAKRSQFHVEEGRHRSACALARSGRQEAMVGEIFRTAGRWVLDFALPPRCAGCGTIVDDVHSFCPDCWKNVEFLGHSGCMTCGLPLQATEQTTCGVCLARPPRIARTRSAVAYGEVARNLAIRLKYGRKVAIARTMARYMAPLVSNEGDCLLVPVPLHRTRLWSRGFNQSALVARELSHRLRIDADPFALRRIRRTPPLKGMSPLQRRRTVSGAFRVRDKQRVAGKTVILVDDVLTTGSTAEACARTLKRAGAARIELVSWARVVKPLQLMR